MLAAAFLARNVSLLGLEPHGRYFNFIFDDSEHRKEIEQQWWSGTLNVKAVKYADAIKRLKNLIYSKK